MRGQPNRILPFPKESRPFPRPEVYVHLKRIDIANLELFFYLRVFGKFAYSRATHECVGVGLHSAVHNVDARRRQRALRMPLGRRSKSAGSTSTAEMWCEENARPKSAPAEVVPCVAGKGAGHHEPRAVVPRATRDCTASHAGLHRASCARRA